MFGRLGGRIRDSWVLLGGEFLCLIYQFDGLFRNEMAQLISVRLHMY